MNPLIKNKVEKFFYTKLVRPIIFYSRLGRKSMFGYADSGINFDHIYKNEAKGYTKFGKFVDRILLNLPACKATRHRKEKIINILRDEIQRNIMKGKKTRIVDLASGPARYLVDLITDDIKGHVEILCLDIDRHSLEYGKKIGTNKPMLYKKANVLRGTDRLRRFAEKKQWIPNIIVSSGLYEYLDDEAVKKSFNDIFRSIEQSGLFLFVTQMNSPNKKLIEHVGITKSGKKWILFYRKPEILQDWMHDAGYDEVNFEIDPWGMYEFFKGRKPSS